MGNFFQKELPREQWVMGSVFTAMGLATVLFPGLVFEYAFEKEYLGTVTPALTLVTQCFGSQAALCGLTILSTKWNKVSYRNFGLAMIPYFIFDIYARSVGAVTTIGAIGDGIGNVIFATCCYIGYNKNDEEHNKPLLKESV